MDQRLERILPRVQKPARYTGGEYRQIIKDKAEVDLRLAFCFPDIYEIGMSNIGMRILYATMNRMPGVWCERVFAPWGDMEAEMRRAGIPLYALESGDPVSAFDVVAFSLGYEMAYPAVLNMLDLAGIPLRSADRPELTPLVIAGGTAHEVGLPCTLAEMGISDKDHLMQAAEKACAPGESIHFMPGDVTPQQLYAAMLTADALGNQYYG